MKHLFIAVILFLTIVGTTRANTTGGTIPLGLRDAVAEGRIHKGDLVLLVSVGAGYTAGGILMRWAY